MLSVITGNLEIDKAFKIALGDIFTNIAPYRTTLHSRAHDSQVDIIGPDDEVLNAGLSYPTPWTRDAAINTWNGVGLFMPELTKNTLLSVLEKRNGKTVLKDMYDSQYWDAIIWATGAWQQFLYTFDHDFLSVAFEVIDTALEFFENTEFDEKRNLFRGPASTSDGISGYPDFYANVICSEMHGEAFILDWLDANPQHRAKKGRGMPMFALSTNCLYYNAYVRAQNMADALNTNAKPDWPEKAEKLKKAINDNFWSDRLGRYLYIVDDFGNCDRQECLGHAYAMEFGIADQQQAQSIFENQATVPAGLPVIWPVFDRHKDGTGNSFGRHCGCAWPSFEAIFTTTAYRKGNSDFLLKQLGSLSASACRDMHFAEIYHPVSGEIYGGVQRFKGDELYVWESCPRQTWSATGYIRLILRGLAGIELSRDGINFAPLLTEDVPNLEITGLRYNGNKLSVKIKGPGDKIKSMNINGQETEQLILPEKFTGPAVVEIELTK